MGHARPSEAADASFLSRLAAVNRVLSDGEPPQDRLNAALTQLCLEDDIRHATIGVWRRDTEELIVDARQHANPSVPDVPPAFELRQQAMKTGEPAVAASAEKDDAHLISVPIKAEAETVGVLSIGLAPAGTIDEWVEFCGVVATMVSAIVCGRQAHIESRPNESVQLTRITARASAMKPVFEMIDAVAESDATVLIRGESGTGKELVADAIHHLSHRRDGPFVKVNCAALADGVLESELFGHEAGAFTGATQLRIGRFEAAAGGTIFLDEIGDFSPSLQVTLLRILQQQTFERVGGSHTLRADVRVVAATNRDLETLMTQEKFRQDLYYRLNVFPIHVPPLRQRRSDILLLADTFVERFSKAFNKDVRRITSEAIDLLTAYHWPGNVRELENCIERATLLTKDGVIHAHHLPPTLQTASSSGTEAKGSLAATLGALERELLVDALKDTRGNMAKAARKLGVTERQMGLRVRKYGLTPKGYTSPSA